MGLTRTGRIRHRRKGGTVSGRSNLKLGDYKLLVGALHVLANFRCENPLCCLRSPKLDPHHVVKRSQGGAATVDNIVLLCRTCHDRTDLPHDHAKYLGIEAPGTQVFIFASRKLYPRPSFEIREIRGTFETAYHRYKRGKWQP